MDPDTIFLRLENGERIVGKYKNYSSNKNVKFTALLTNYRLLIRSKQTVCCCYHNSSYTAISLDSIHRIDEYHNRPNTPLYSLLWIFWFLAAIAGIFVSIFFAKDEILKIIGIILSIIPLIITSIITSAYLCCCYKYKFIELNGSFGSIKILFNKQDARVFESQLSEQIFQVKIQSSSNYSLHNKTSSPARF